MKLIFEYHQESTRHIADETDLDLPDNLKRNDLHLPEINEVQIVRHYTELSRKNYGISFKHQGYFQKEHTNEIFHWWWCI